ncbi:MAG: recombinase family protein [Methanoregulaceae archaeon]|nr:recombinase family protein [Methanoregulaceae archaeon]
MRKRVAARTKAVIYARVSSKEQEAEGFSVDAQLRLLRTYAAEQEVDVVREFTEAETAKQSGRRAFGEMLRFLESHPGHVILVEKVDRLYRNFADYVKVDHLGVELHFVKDSMVIGESSKSQDKFMHGIRVLMAKNYVDNLSEEIRKGLNEKAAQGIYPTHSPLGYLNALESGTKRKVIVPDPSRAHQVRELFELYAAGAHSLEMLVAHARKRGLVSKKRHPLAKSAIDQILKQPAYCGIIRWNGREVLGIHEPLVSKELWDRVQDIRKGRGNRKTGFGTLPFAYRGLIACKCGDLLTGEVKKGRYTYYHCTGRKRDICGRPYIAESKIDAAYADLLKLLTVPGEMLPWIQEGLRQADADRHGSRAKREREIRAECAAISSRLEKLYLDKVEGEISAEFYRETRAKWEARVTEMKLELAALDRTEPVLIDEAMRVFELASTAHLRFKSADSEQKRELIKLMCSNSSWVDGRLEVELHEFFDLMLNLVKSGAQNENETAKNGLAKVKSEDWWRQGDSNP